MKKKEHEKLSSWSFSENSLIRFLKWKRSYLLLSQTFILEMTWLFAEHSYSYVMRCAIWYLFHNLKNVTNANGGVFIPGFISPSTLLKVAILHWYFSRFLNYTNCIKSCNKSHIFSNSLEWTFVKMNAKKTLFSYSGRCKVMWGNKVMLYKIC